MKCYEKLRMRAATSAAGPTPVAPRNASAKARGAEPSMWTSAEIPADCLSSSRLPGWPHFSIEETERCQSLISKRMKDVSAKLKASKGDLRLQFLKHQKQNIY